MSVLVKNTYLLAPHNTHTDDTNDERHSINTQHNNV
jgi:hypothetical protein